MRYIVAREMPGRMRVRLEGPVPESDMGALCSLLDACPDIVTARVYPLIGSIAVTYEPVDEVRSRVLDFHNRHGARLARVVFAHHRGSDRPARAAYDVAVLGQP